MRRIFIILFAFISLAVRAQKKLSPKTVRSHEHIFNDIQNSVKNISPSTGILLLKWKANKKKWTDNTAPIFLPGDSGLADTYGIITNNKVSYVNAFIVVTDDFKIDDIIPFGFLSGTLKKTMVTGLIPIDEIEKVANHPHVLYLSTEEKGTPALDSARNSTKVNLVHQGYQLSQSYFGDGVIVGIIDIGLNYTHPNFYDSTGKTNFRIKRVWEQLATSGTMPPGYSYGRELTTETQILNAQRDITIYSHGTHVAGIAAGAGGGVNDTYMGVAPKSDIVMVSSDGTPAKLLDGVNYIMNYAASVNKPCVINLSWGSQIGPHDGTSAFDKGCDLLVGPGKIIVGAAGNQGADSIYLSKTYSAVDTTLFSFLKFPLSSSVTNGQTTVDIWGAPNEDFKIAVNIYNTSTNLYEDNTNYYSANISATIPDTLYDSDAIADTCFLVITTGINPLNNKPHAMVSINNSMQEDNNQFIQIEIIARNTQTKAWAAGGGAVFSTCGYGGNVLGGSTTSTMVELGGTGNSIISVGAYTSKNTFKALNGNTLLIPFYTPAGAIAPFSSNGPTADGRTKPDITAPGNAVISSVNRYDSRYTAGSNRVVSVVTNNATNWYFGVDQGTSLATPMVTGTIALWLQADPTLTPAQVKTYLKDSAILDSFTGAIPIGGSNVWGWGKLDAYRGLKKVLNSVVYTFVGSGNWDLPSNWTNNIIPPATLTAGSIIIDPAANGTCILNRAQVISQNSKLTIIGNKSLLVPDYIKIQ